MNDEDQQRLREYVQAEIESLGKANPELGAAFIIAARIAAEAVTNYFDLWVMNGEGAWFPKVLVVPEMSRMHRDEQGRGTSTQWAEADIVVDTMGVVLKNKYGPTGRADWAS